MMCLANDILDKGLISKIYKNSHDSTPGRQSNLKKKKMSKGLEQTLPQGGHTGGPETYEMMLSITRYQRDAN